jgi:hypothetical protein
MHEEERENTEITHMERFYARRKRVVTGTASVDELLATRERALCWSRHADDHSPLLPNQELWVSRFAGQLRQAPLIAAAARAE